MVAGSRSFYEKQFRSERNAAGAADRAEWTALDEFCRRYGLGSKRVLEIGSGRGAFQGIVSRWVGLDLARTAGNFVQKPFVSASATALPFCAASFDAALSITVLEHVPDPERALDEIARVLKPGGVAYLAPAWHCRPWAAKGLHVRPWSDLAWTERLEKATIPLRESLFLRAARELPSRVAREMALARRRTGLSFRYRRLRPNYERFWCADSDACNSMDPHEMLMWFLSRGFGAPSHPTFLSRFFVRHGAIVVRKPARS